MKRLLSLCFLLQFSATVALAIQSASAVHNWYFDFRSGKTVDRVRGVKANEKIETLVIERAFGRYIGDDAFMLDSEVESDSGVHLISGTARWEAVGDHFEAEIKAGAATYRGILHIYPSQKAVLEIFMGTSRMSRGEYHVQRGTLYGRTDIYDTAGTVVTVCDSECKKGATQPPQRNASSRPSSDDSSESETSSSLGPRG